MMDFERLGAPDENKGKILKMEDYPPFDSERAKKAVDDVKEKMTQSPVEHEEMETEREVFAGDAIFTDIDGTLTDNSGRIDPENADRLREFMDGGGTFVPVTGRARFESVRGIVERLDLPFIIINNGAEIFNRDGEHIYESVIPDEQVHEAFAIAEQNGLTWMQNKRDLEGKEYLFSNFTEESEAAMKEVGIKDTVRNEEGRIGLSAKQATAEEVMAIPGQNYKIQMMSPNPEAVQRAYDEFQRLGIPCMLNMQSEKTGKFHWVEVIKGTKHDTIQRLIDMALPDVKEVITMGDGGNDISMLKAEYRDGNGNPVENFSLAVRNASESVMDSVKAATLDRYNSPMADPTKESFGIAVARTVDYLENKHKMDDVLAERKKIYERARKIGLVLPEIAPWSDYQKAVGF
ncbi:HAD family hydrolase [Candidatus Saccharibacteria bacterium]|nr:HAD family hydrolase [Candidatus Saccharibacteria bacterium]